MSRAVSRSRSNSGRAATAAARRAMKLGPLRARAFCRPALARAEWAFSLNAEDVEMCMGQEIAPRAGERHGLGRGALVRYPCAQANEEPRHDTHPYHRGSARRRD